MSILTAIYIAAAIIIVALAYFGITHHRADKVIATPHPFETEYPEYPDALSPQPIFIPPDYEMIDKPIIAPVKPLPMPVTPKPVSQPVVKAPVKAPTKTKPVKPSKKDAKKNAKKNLATVKRNRANDW